MEMETSWPVEHHVRTREDSDSTAEESEADNTAHKHLESSSKIVGVLDQHSKLYQNR